MKNNRAAIFLATGYEMAEAIITIDILRRAKIQVDIVTTTEELSVKSSHDVLIKCDQKLAAINFSNYDILILPGGSQGVANLNQNTILKAQLVKFAQDDTKLVAAICAAPQILGQLNLLINKEVTFYPGCDLGLEKAIKTNKPVVVSGNIITGKSIGCAIEFALQIVSKISGQKVVDQVRTGLEL